MCNHRVPINKTQIRELQRFALEPLQPPRHVPFETVIALDSARQCVMGAKGALQRLSPPEPAFAVIFSIGDAIIQEAGDDAFGKWRHALLTASFRFELATSGGDRYWRAQNLRQGAIEMGIVPHLSVRQWIYDVVGFKASKEKDLGRELGSAQVAKHYHEKMKYARGTEGVSASFVGSTLTVHRGVLSSETARQWLEWCDEHLMEKSPWSTSIYALQALVDRAQTTSRITWAICGLTDLHRMDSITAGEFTISRMQDYRQSYIEVINLKHAMRDELLQTWLPGIGLPIEHVKKMQEAFADFPNARASVTGYPDEPTVDTTWMVGWPPSSVAACTFPEECIYTCSYDGRYRDAVKSKAKVADILEHESVKREIDEIAATLAQTRAAAAAARGETPAVDPATPAPTTGTTTATPESKGFHSMEQQDQEHWEKIIKKHVHTHVDIIVEKTAAELENAIRDSTLAGIRGDPTGLALFHFDVKQSGEPLTRLELRVAPLRDANYHRLVRTVLNARAPAGGTPGLRSGEASIANRRKKLRSCTGGLHQSECAHMLSHTKVPLPERSRKRYPGSTSGDAIMGVEATEAEKEWTMSWSDKKALYGKKNLIAVGGKTKGASPDDVVERKTDSTQVPVTHHGMPPAWYDELTHMKAIVALTPLDAKFAWQAMLNRAGYVGIAFTEEHKTMIYARLVEQMKTEMCQTGSKLYNAQYAKAAGLTETPPPAPPPNLKRRPRRKPAAVPTAEPGTGGDGEPENDNPEPEDDGLVGDPDPENAWDILHDAACVMRTMVCSMVE
ncbi:unnamed protein product [Prorocentrum cordatum]|uniref:Uncharacterized protein n=1 Tax=Prorocentrum cordatum TaxID=2364126 RepID=A0ABN9V2N3_9DINO|nr:unnamed protein product [Polarella glacialis]